MRHSNAMVSRGMIVKQAALYRKVETQVQPEAMAEVADYADEPKWSPRRRIAFITAAALASWGVVFLMGYGIYSLVS